MFTVGLAVAGARALANYQTALDKVGSELVDMSGRANIGIEALQRLLAADGEHLLSCVLLRGDL